MRAVAAALADNGKNRGSYARVKCGRRIQRRTVVVSLEFPALRPSASLSQGTVLVSRTTNGYHVWSVLQ